jgi:hypothetical protein
VAVTEVDMVVVVVLVVVVVVYMIGFTETDLILLHILGLVKF